MSENQAPESSPQLAMMQRLVELAEERTRHSAERSEMSEQRSYLNAERTLSVWVRTALSLMIFGLAVDRFGLLLRRLPSQTGQALPAHNLSSGVCVALVAFGVWMVVTSGLRFLAYGVAWRRAHQSPKHHGPFLAFSYAVLVAIFGVALLVILLGFAP